MSVASGRTYDDIRRKEVKYRCTMEALIKCDEGSGEATSAPAASICQHKQKGQARQRNAARCAGPLKGVATASILCEMRPMGVWGSRKEGYMRGVASRKE